MEMYDTEEYWYGISRRKFEDILNEYKKINPNVKVLFWNLMPYGDATPIKFNNNILEVSGFSDKIIEIAAKIINSGDIYYMIKEIENVAI